MSALISNRKRIYAACAVALAACFVLHLVHLQVINLLPFKFEFEKNRFIMKPELAQACSLGFKRLYADLNWLNFIQYYGDRRAFSQDKLRYAPSYLRLIIRLDPHFKAPYWFASFVLAGDLGLTKQATEILDDGIKDNPDDWSLPYIAGFNQYYYAKDQDRAADYYERASKIAGAPEFLARFANTMRSHVSLTIQMVIKQWEKIFNHSDGVVREKARQQLQELWSAVYLAAPTEQIRNRAEEKLKQFEVPLLSDAVLPNNLKTELQKLKQFDAEFIESK